MKPKERIKMEIDFLNFVVICGIVSLVSGTLRKEKLKDITIEVIRSFVVLTVGILIFAIFLYFLDEPILIFGAS
jgi:hypothetical protein